MPPTDPLEQYLLDHENDMHLRERNEIDQMTNTLKYAYLDEKKYILLLLVLTFQNMKKKDY